MLMSYHWPGNVRELEIASNARVLVAEGDVVHPFQPAAYTPDARGDSVPPPKAA
jgi:DNA-binding NtrC family response regulator